MITSNTCDVAWGLLSTTHSMPYMKCPDAQEAAAILTAIGFRNVDFLTNYSPKGFLKFIVQGHFLGLGGLLDLRGAPRSSGSPLLRTLPRHCL